MGKWAVCFFGGSFCSAEFISPMAGLAKNITYQPGELKQVLTKIRNQKDEKALARGKRKQLNAEGS